jgi:hypothetical protein
MQEKAIKVLHISTLHHPIHSLFILKKKKGKIKIMLC